jgi:hypothetical protein
MRYLSIDENCGDNLGYDCSILVLSRFPWNVFRSTPIQTRTDNNTEEVFVRSTSKVA